MNAGVPLSDQQQAAILNKEGGKTNVSRRKSAAFYYDEESIDMVARADAYLIHNYRYLPPVNRVTSCLYCSRYLEAFSAAEKCCSTLALAMVVNCRGQLFVG